MLISVCLLGFSSILCYHVKANELETEKQAAERAKLTKDEQLTASLADKALISHIGSHISQLCFAQFRMSE